MPWIDVSDISLDPMLAGETFSVLRRKVAVNAFGEATTTTTTFSAVVGQVSPTGDNSLVRQEAFSAQKKSIRVITSFRLRGEALQLSDNSTWQPDIVVWHGGNYLVRSVEDYSGFGAGLVEAECVLFDFLPPST